MNHTSKTCPDLLHTLTFTSEELGQLRSRDYELQLVEDLAFEDIGSKKADEPSDWVSRVIASISTEGVLQPIMVVEDTNGLVLVDGNHRAWVAHRLLLTAPVHILNRECTECTEAELLEEAFERTKALGWGY